MKTNNKPSTEKLNLKTSSKIISDFYPYLNPLLTAVLTRNELFLMRDWSDHHVECTFNDYADWLNKIEILYADFGLNKAEIISLISATEKQWDIPDTVKRRMFYYSIVYAKDYLNKKRQNNQDEEDGDLRKSALDVFAKYDFSEDVFISKFNEFVKIVNSNNPKLCRAIRKAIKLSLTKRT